MSNEDYGRGVCYTDNFCFARVLNDITNLDYSMGADYEPGEGKNSSFTNRVVNLLDQTGEASTNGCRCLHDLFPQRLHHSAWSDGGEACRAVDG